jgi:hypothetical protein
VENVTDHNQHKDDTNNADHSALDRELDAALAKFAAVEPRTGLENRILANLRAERTHAAQHSSWRWPVAAALGAMIVVVAISLAWRSRKPDQNITTQHPPAIVQPPEHAGTQVAKNDAPKSIRPHDTRPRRRLTTLAVSSAATIVATAPKLDQFPSPQPLSEQEKILAHYVANYPEHAALIAQARTEELRRDRAEEMREAAPAGNQDSQQQNK